jgi:hypothetical protein
MFWEDSENFPTSIAKILDSRKKSKGRRREGCKITS